MNLQENIQRIKQMMGLLTEVTNPYKVEWLEPTQEYFTQELSELLGNEMRFSKGEFFHPDNFDQMYSLFPHTFKMIAEHAKGEEVESEQEIKEILLDKEVSDLMNDWGKFRHILMKDPQSQQEGLDFFSRGEMQVRPEFPVRKWILKLLTCLVPAWSLRLLPAMLQMVHPFETDSLSDTTATSPLYKNNNKIIKVNHRINGFEDTGKSYVSFKNSNSFGGFDSSQINNVLYQVKNTGTNF